MGRVCRYYSDWQREVFACEQCGWAGTVGFEDLEVGDVAAIIECPKCFGSLGVVLFPNLQDTRDAAIASNQEAIEALPFFESRINHNWQLLGTFDREKVQSADQLPDLEGESVEFQWDFLKGEDGEWYQSITHGDAELWRELAFFNNVRRFTEVKKLLRMKYGSRFKSLTPTLASIEWLSGDDLGRALQIKSS
jgi:hypothetical protein